MTQEFDGMKSERWEGDVERGSWRRGAKSLLGYYLALMGAMWVLAGVVALIEYAPAIAALSALGVSGAVSWWWVRRRMPCVARILALGKQATHTWAALGAALALSAVLLHTSWYAVFPPTLTERREVQCERYYEPWGYCDGVMLLKLAGILLGAAGLTGFGAVAARRIASDLRPQGEQSLPTLAEPTSVQPKTLCIHGHAYEDCDDCEGFWTPEGDRR